MRNMQNPQQRRSARRQWPPAPDAHKLHGGGGQRQRANESRRRFSRPGKKRQRRQRHSRAVAPRVAPRHGFQRIGRKARHDAPGDHRFQHGNQRHAQVQPGQRFDIEPKVRAGMDQRVGGRQRKQQKRREVVAAITGAVKQAPDDKGQRRQKSKVDDRRQNGHAGKHRQPPGQPERDQRGQAPALRRRQPRPDLPGGQQKTGDDGNGEAEHHFVAVPEHARQNRRKFNAAGVEGEPQRQRQCGEQRAQQIKGAKAEGKQGKAGGRRFGAKARFVDLNDGQNETP